MDNPRNFKSTRLKTLQIRITPQQADRLNELRDTDGISVQDHIRRALDRYLRRPNPLPMAPEGQPGEAPADPGEDPPEQVNPITATTPLAPTQDRRVSSRRVNFR